jgi:hypothetical protein
VPVRTKRAPIPALDNDGREIYLVPLANTSLKARVLREDYHRLIAEGWSSQWVWNCDSVKLNRYRQNLHRLGRLLMNPSEGFRVKHWDRDPLNLRSDTNLHVVPFKRHEPHPQSV